MKISIDFQAGAHGNFLEFVCNKVAGVDTPQMPFNKFGAAHNKKYLSNQVFFADHYSFWPRPIVGNKVIAIKIDQDDLLPLNQISLLRAGDFGLDSNELEINTYHKLNNSSYKWVLDIIIESFFKNQIQTSYNNVKDPAWPNVKTLHDFENLPNEIIRECIDVHKLVLLELNKENPHCPRNVLREFFEIGFLDPTLHGFIQRQKQMQYASNIEVYEFPFHAFYNTILFIDQIKRIAQWLGLVYNNWGAISELHNEFLQRQPYKHSKLKCDSIVEQIINGQSTPAVNLIEESYINAMLTKQGYERRY